MEIKELISMTDFVLNQRKSEAEIKNMTFYDIKTYIYKNHDIVWNYANFLKRKIKLEMFVPCGERYQNVLDEPNYSKFEHSEDYDIYLKTYSAAREKVLFAGFYQEYNATKTPTGGYLNTNLFNHNIEFLIGVKGIKLTEAALKQIYK